MPTSPYNLNITLYDTDGTTVAVSKLVTARNETTNETINNTTNGSGQTILNIGNLASGYSDGDVITIYSVDGSNTVYTTHIVDISAGSFTTSLTYIDTSVADSTELRYFTATEFREFYCLTAYNASSAPEGIKTVQIERIGEGVEGEIDRIIQQKFDDNDGSNYTSTNEYHNAIDMYQKDYFSDWGPILSVSKFEVNEEAEGLTPPVYLAQDKYQAESYAEIAMGTNGLEKDIPEEWFNNIIILSVDINNLDTKFFETDPYVRGVPSEGQTFIYNSRILPGIINELV